MAFKEFEILDDDYRPAFDYDNPTVGDLIEFLSAFPADQQLGWLPYQRGRRLRFAQFVDGVGRLTIYEAKAEGEQ